MTSQIKTTDYESKPGNIPENVMCDLNKFWLKDWLLTRDQTQLPIITPISHIEEVNDTFAAVNTVQQLRHECNSALRVHTTQ